MSWVSVCSQVGRGNWIGLEDVFPVLSWGVWGQIGLSGKVEHDVRKFRGLGDRQLDTCPSSELLCSEAEKPRLGYYTGCGTQVKSGRSWKRHG